MIPMVSEVKIKDLISNKFWKWRPVVSEVKIEDIISTKAWKWDQLFQRQRLMTEFQLSFENETSGFKSKD